MWILARWDGTNLGVDECTDRLDVGVKELLVVVDAPRSAEEDTNAIFLFCGFLWVFAVFGRISDVAVL